MPNRTHLQGLSALPECKACLSVWYPYSVHPEAELSIIVWGQLTCREGGREKKSRKNMLVGIIDCMKMDIVSALPTTVHKQNQSIQDMGIAILHW